MEEQERPRRPAARSDTAPAPPATRHELLQGKLTGRVIRACHIVHDVLKAEFAESVYEGSLAKVLRTWGITVQRQHPLDVVFWGEVVGAFRIDLLVEDALLVELKAVRQFAPEHDAQMLNYLRASGRRVGLLVNFGPRLEVKRFVR
jgi:GxxExxY protein